MSAASLPSFSILAATLTEGSPFLGPWDARVICAPPAGPVTAVAVLPNTALVLSASQDGTLRTWDLQAAAQVGEVALTCWGRGVPSESVSRLLAPAGPGWPLLSLGAHSVGLWRARELYSPLAQLSAPVLHLQLAPALPKPTAPHAVLPTRLVCACADGSVYLVSVTGGHTVSALLLEPDDCAAAVAYCLPREALWVLTRAGHLLCANAARSPMRVLHRLCPPPPPAPQPCCLHLYSHLTDPASAFTNWEIVCQYKGELCRSDVAWAWKDKNRWVPQPAGAGQDIRACANGLWSPIGTCPWWGTLTAPCPYSSCAPPRRSSERRHTARALSLPSHPPGTASCPLVGTFPPSPPRRQGTPSLPRGATVAPARTGGDLTVKMWRVFPYAEESLSPLRTFCCCHPAVVLCALGKRVTVGFEDLNSATYGLVQFGLGSSPRYDHRPQDDPTDRITGEGAGPRGSPGLQVDPAPKAEFWPPGLCCCPTLKLYACSSLDCTIRIWTAENKLLRWAGEGWGRGAAAWVSRLHPTGARQLERVQGWPGPCLCSCLGVLLREAGLDSHPEPPSRLLHLNGAPQALTFCSNSGDLVLALGSRLCLVDHRLYLPTSYLLKVCSEHRWVGRGCCGQTSRRGQGSRLLSLFRSCAKRTLIG